TFLQLRSFAWLRSDVRRLSLRAAIALSQIASSELTEHTKHAHLRSGKLLRKPCAQHLRVRLAQRIDHQTTFDLLIAAAQLFLHRYRHTGRIEREPNFAAGDIRVPYQILQRRS